MDERPKHETGNKKPSKYQRRTKAITSMIHVSNFLLDMSPEAREAKAILNNWDFIKIENFCTEKEKINKTKRKISEWEKISANDISDKGLVSKNTERQIIQ